MKFLDIFKFLSRHSPFLMGLYASGLIMVAVCLLSGGTFAQEPESANSSMSLDQPHKSPEELIQWAQNTILSALERNLPRQSAEPYPKEFTTAAWQALQKELKTLQSDVKSKAILTGIYNKRKLKSLITQKGSRKNIFIWVLMLELENSDDPAQKLQLQVTVRRVPETINPFGAAIENVGMRILSGVATTTAGNECIKSVPARKIFQNLKTINIYIDIPAWAKEALECHGNEESCSMHARDYDSGSFNSSKFIEDLKARYDRYPESLHPKMIEAVLRQKIQNKWSMFLDAPDACHGQGVNLINRENLYDVVQQPNSLTVTLKVEILQSVEPKMALLSGGLFRPDYSFTVYDDSIDVVDAFTLKADELSNAKQLENYIEHVIFSVHKLSQDEEDEDGDTIYR